MNPKAKLVLPLRANINAVGSAKINIGTGIIAPMTPTAVAAPRPPRNLSQMGQICPTIAPIALAITR